MKKRIYFPSAFLLAGLLTALLQWQSLIPSVGTVSKSPGESEMRGIDEQLIKMEVLISRINRIVIQSGFRISTRQTMNQKWIELDRAWAAFKQHPDKLRSHSGFFRALVEQHESILDLRPDVAEKTKFMAMSGEKGEFLLYYIDSLSDQTLELKKTYQAHAKTFDLSRSGSLWYSLALFFVILAIIFFIKSPRRGLNGE